MVTVQWNYELTDPKWCKLNEIVWRQGSNTILCNFIYHVKTLKTETFMTSLPYKFWVS